MNWLEAILSRLADLWPWVRTKVWQKAVRTTFIPFREAKVRVFGGGRIIRAIPWIDSVEIRDCQVDGYNLPTQSVTTVDGKIVSFSVNFFFEIEDVKAATFEVRDFASTLQDLAMVHLAERIREQSWDEVRLNQKKLEDSLKGTLTTRAKEWGVKITKVGITDFVPAKQLRVFGELNTV